ncbi:hypothetical protein MTO96_034218 [Rhipicephalus appendiculatus]
MAEEAVDMFCFHLYELSMEQLRSLEDDNVIPGLRLRDAPDREEACDKVRIALEVKLQWALFALDKTMPPVDDFTLQMMLTSVLSLPGADIGYVPVSSGNGLYACAITAEQQSEPEDGHIVVGMCALAGLAVSGDLFAR